MKEIKCNLIGRATSVTLRLVCLAADVQDGGKKAFARSSLEWDLRYMVEHEPNINQHCHAAVKKGKCHIGMYKQEYSLHDP